LFTQRVRPGTMLDARLLFYTCEVACAVAMFCIYQLCRVLVGKHPN